MGGLAPAKASKRDIPGAVTMSLHKESGLAAWCAGAGLVVIGLVLAVMAGSGAAEAHAILQSSTPALNAKVEGPDLEVLLRFNSRIDQSRCRVSVVLADGTQKPVGLGAKQSDPSVLTGRVQGLVAGAYTLSWRVLAVDGHMTRGRIPFMVGK